MKGIFITFEGTEGSGKTTQILRLLEWLNTDGQHLVQSLCSSIITTREPGATPVGSQLRELVLHDNTIHPRTELLMYAADRAQHVETVLKPALAKQQLILCDRYTDSTFAYQGYGRGLDLELVERLLRIATNDLKPNVTFWLDLDVEVGLERASRRAGLDRLEQEKVDFHQRVREGYKALYERESRIAQINAAQSSDQVAAQIQKVMSIILKTGVK